MNAATLTVSQLPQRQTQLQPLPLTGVEAATRAACLLKLATFAETFYPGWQAARVHRLLASKLEDCFRRKIKRLAISIGPQHGKSRLTSINFPAWAMTKEPTLRFFQAGHNADLSKGFSREARQLVSSDRYAQIFPDLINPMVNRQDYWQTKLGGYYYATSVGGGTGTPADILLVDDAHRDRAEANSKTKRDAVWEWFTSTATTRLAPDGVIIVCQTRWHTDDLIGRLTDPKRVREFEEAGFSDMNFEVLSLEAICESPETDPLRRKFGEALWPEVRPIAFLEAKKLEITTDEFNALYQGRPNRVGGNLVDIAGIKVIERSALPSDLVEVRAWDLALTIGQKADHSVGSKGALHRYKGPDGKWLEDFYLTHIHRSKNNWPEQKQIILNFINQEAVGGTIGLETVGAFKIAAAELKESLQGKCIVKSINVHKDKAARANPWMAKIHGGRFFMVRAPWNREFLNELSQFPNGIHDDQVDSVSILWETVRPKNRLLVA